MADNAWRQSFGPAYDGRTRTGIAAVLGGFAQRGGQLVAARGWEENPLVLTHVRWIGPRGEMVDAVRPPDDDAVIGAAEREVWVELALGFPALHPSPAGRDAPWLPLDLSPQQAASLLDRLPGSSSLPPLGNRPAGVGGFVGNRRLSAGPGTLSPVGGTIPSGSPAWGGDLRDAVLYDEGVSVIPCVEIELPPVAGPATPGTSAAMDAFVRDVAATFIRAAQGLPHVVEMRGWQRGGRLVLAVRLIVAPGSGAPTREEDDRAMRSLARVLAQETLPYAQLTMAHPGEWARGQSLPV